MYNISLCCIGKETKEPRRTDWKKGDPKLAEIVERMMKDQKPHNKKPGHYAARKGVSKRRDCREKTSR